MKALSVPPCIETALGAGGALAISISGGKDSQALLVSLLDEVRARGWRGSVYAIHAHLGRAEWPQTLAHIRNLCARLNVELIEVRRPQGDLVDEMKQRMETLRGTGKPFWPDAQNRYCTADQKRSQIDRDHRRHEVVVAAMGMRAQESHARAKREVATLRKGITAKALQGLSPDDALCRRAPGQRVAIDWLPLHHWRLEDVWEACGHPLADLQRRQTLHRDGRVDEALDGWQAHPAYVLGNERLSCALCVLASKNDLQNGARQNPALYAEYVAMEQESGCTFRQDLALGDLFTEPAGTQLRLLDMLDAGVAA